MAERGIGDVSAGRKRERHGSRWQKEGYTIHIFNKSKMNTKNYMLSACHIYICIL